MTDIDRNPVAETDYREHLERSARVWDRWSNWYAMSERDFEPLRLALIDRLAIESGDRVLDVGCGPGVNFEPLREAVGAEGTVDAIDFSPRMIATARARIDDYGWENVSVAKADATTADLAGPYDVATASLSLSVMPDVPRAVENVHGALAPTGRIGVLDIGRIQAGPARVFNPALTRFLRWYANWHPDGDVRGAIEATFGEYALHETRFGGAIYTAVASRSAE